MYRWFPFLVSVRCLPAQASACTEEGQRFTADSDQPRTLLDQADELRVRALDFAYSGAVKLQDFFYVMNVMHSSSNAGMEATWAHFTTNVAKYRSMLEKAGPSLMDACIRGACAGFASPARAAEVTQFFADNKALFPSNQRTIEQNIEAINTSCAYLQKFQTSGALAWLQARKVAAGA